MRSIVESSAASRLKGSRAGPTPQQLAQTPASGLHPPTHPPTQPPTRVLDLHGHAPPVMQHGGVHLADAGRCTRLPLELLQPGLPAGAQLLHQLPLQLAPRHDVGALAHALERLLHLRSAARRGAGVRAAVSASEQRQRAPSATPAPSAPGRGAPCLRRTARLRTHRSKPHTPAGQPRQPRQRLPHTQPRQRLPHTQPRQRLPPQHTHSPGSASPTWGGSTFSSWMLSIWPSLSAAPRMRHSALASRSAFCSVMKFE